MADAMGYVIAAALAGFISGFVFIGAAVMDWPVRDCEKMGMFTHGGRAFICSEKKP